MGWMGFRVRGSSGSRPLDLRWCGPCEEAATQEQTPEPGPHPQGRGRYSE